MLLIADRKSFREMRQIARDLDAKHLASGGRPLKRPYWDRLHTQLAYLHGYATGWQNEELSAEEMTRALTKTVCVLFDDNAPGSMFFKMYQRKSEWSWPRYVLDCWHLDKFDYLNDAYAPWFVGGLILHGAGDSGIGGPTFTVRHDISETDWSINT